MHHKDFSERIFLKRNSGTGTEQRKKNRKWLIILVASNVVTLIATALLAMGLLFPKPNVTFERVSASLVLEENRVLITAIVENTGSAPEADVIVWYETYSPWIFENNSTWYTYQVGELSAGQSIATFVKAYNPSVQQLGNSGYILYSAKIYGASKEWKTETRSASW